MSIPLQAIVLLVVFVLLAMALWGIIVAQCRGWLRLIDMWSRPDRESEGRGMSQLPKKWYVGYDVEYDIDSGDDGRTIGYPTGGDEFDGTVFEVDGDQIETVAEQIRDEKTAHLIAAAPDLLKALKSLELLSEISLESADPARVAARKAIAKARGGE